VSGALTEQTAASTAIGAAEATIIDDMWSALVSGGYTTGWTAELEAFTRADAATFLRAIRWVLDSANEQPMLDFQSGLFDWNAQPVFDSGKAAAFTFAFNHMRDSINALSISGAAQTIVTNLVAALNTCLDPDETVRRPQPSKITAIGHTFSVIFGGVARTNVPPAQNRARIQDSILQTNRGKVTVSGQDDEGNALFVGGLEINAATGELGGLPFENAVRRIATEVAISLGGRG
jgi:hypothetical protein